MASGTETFQANRSFFKNFDPALLTELAGVEAKGTLLIEEPLPNLEISGHQIHEGPDLIAAAKDLVAGRPNRLHVHFGFGLGYLLEADEVQAEGLILVFEPCPGLLHQAMQVRPLAGLFERRRAGIICNLERFRQTLYACWYSADSIRLIINPPHRQLFPQAYSAFKRIIQKICAYDRFKRRTQERMDALIAESTWRSLPRTAQLPDVADLQDQLKGIPAVIVSAGPSLERDLPLLRQFRDRVAIFSISRAVAPLARMGIAPDFLVHVEAQRFYEHIHNCPNLMKTHFLLADQPDLDYLNHPHGKTFLFTTPDNPISSWLSQNHPELGRTQVPSSGSVSSVAFHLARIMGCGPILLLGQDLALPQGRHYADVPDRVTTEGLPQIESIFGDERPTLDQYLITAYWYEDQAAAFTPDDPHLYQCSVGGARLEGFRAAAFADVISSFADCRIPIDQVSLSHRPQPDLAADTRILNKTLQAMIQLDKRFRTISHDLRQRLKKAKKEREVEVIRKKLTGLVRLNEEVAALFAAHPEVSPLFVAVLQSFNQLGKRTAPAAGDAADWKQLLIQKLDLYGPCYAAAAELARHWQTLTNGTSKR